MVNLLKGFGKGILYIIGLPFFLLFLLLYAIYGIFLFFFMVFKAIILFFTGRSLFQDLPEDRKAKEILHPTQKPQLQPEPTVAPQPAPAQQSEPTNSGATQEVTPQYIPPIYPSVYTPEYVPPKDEPNPGIAPEPAENEEVHSNEPSGDIEVNNDKDVLADFLDKEEPMPVNTPVNKKEETIEKYTPKTSLFDDFEDDDSDKSSGGVRMERSDK